jgi:hypothetical protein
LRFPESEYEPEVLYTLYLILKDSDLETAERYASALKTDFPNSTFAKILINPAYLQESSLAAEKQKGLYKIAYEFYENGNFRAADSVIKISHQFGETSFSPSLELLEVLITGETEDISQYQYKLGLLAEKYPELPVSAYAKTLLEKSRNFLEVQEKTRGIQYDKFVEQPHYFVLVHRRSEKLEELVSTGLELFNQTYFAEHSLNISNLTLSDEYSITFVADIPNVTTAIDYYHTFIEKLPTINGFRNHKFDNFVITKDNFDTFYRTKGLNEYLQFFEKTYPKKKQ